MLMRGSKESSHLSIIYWLFPWSSFLSLVDVFNFLKRMNDSKVFRKILSKPVNIRDHYFSFSPISSPNTNSKLSMCLLSTNLPIRASYFYIWASPSLVSLSLSLIFELTFSINNPYSWKKCTLSSKLMLLSFHYSNFMRQCCCTFPIIYC